MLSHIFYFFAWKAVGLGAYMVLFYLLQLCRSLFRNMFLILAFPSLPYSQVVFTPLKESRD